METPFQAQSFWRDVLLEWIWSVLPLPQETQLNCLIQRAIALNLVKTYSLTGRKSQGRTGQLEVPSVGKKQYLASSAAMQFGVVS